MDPILFKIFLSSPGDVQQERDDAQAAIEEISKTGEFANHFILRLYRWDDKEVVIPMAVTDIPQKSVDVYMTLPSACHLVVCIFWSKMGSPLVMDEREYLSGTHYEYSEALLGYKQKRIPTVWLYRCAEEPIVGMKDPKRDEKSKQFDNVEQFFKQFQDAEGRFIGGVNLYKTHSEFKEMFKAQLLTHLRWRRDNPQSNAKVETTTKKQFTGTPYRGLNALDEDDSPIFFGREAEILEILNRVESKSLVAILGASGSGKSSLVAAGVLPKLRSRGWKIVRCVPSDDPFYQLALALVSQLPEMGVKPFAYLGEARKLANTLRIDPKKLAQLISHTFNKQHVLLFVDQFEEIFTLAEKNTHLLPDEFKTFIQTLKYSLPQMTVLLAMRADFYSMALSYFEELRQEPYFLTKPSVFAIQDLITRPAELVGLELDAGLAQLIIADVGDDNGALALIAYLMEALYLRSNARGDHKLTKKDYIDLGGVIGAINTLAETAYDSLPFDETNREKAIHNVFRELITITNEDGRLIPTRRRASLSKFEEQSSEIQLIDIFINARLLVSDKSIVEVAHEAILREWDRLKEWISTIENNLFLRDTILKEAKEWSAKQDPEDVWHYNHLKNVYKLLEDNIIPEDQIDDNFKKYIRLECDWWLDELEKSVNETSHYRRLNIGRVLLPKFVSQLLEDLPKLDFLHTDERLEDPRIYKGLRLSDGLPNIIWCDVAGDVFDNHLPSANEHIHVNFHGFSISKYPITRGQYQAFIEDVNGYTNSKWWAEFNEYYDHPHEIEDNFNHPMENLSWYDAMVFCNWLTDAYHHHGVLPLDEIISLPTEWEWQFAAQGRNNDKWYPWDDWQTLPEKPANIDQSKLKQTTAVGMYPLGQSSFGVEDMSGNVWEWCLNESQHWDHIELSRESRSRRGGYYGSDEKECRVVERDPLRPQLRRAAVGFRIVKCTHDINKRFKRLNQ